MKLARGARMLPFVLTLHLFSPALQLAAAPIAPVPIYPYVPPAPTSPAPRPSPAPREVHLAPPADPLAGSFSFGELGLASLGVLVTIIACSALAASEPDNTAWQVGWSVSGLALDPVVASLLAWAIASNDAAGSFLKALLRAGLVQLGGMLLMVGTVALTVNDEGEGPVVVWGIMFGVIELIGLPIAASFGMHAGPARPQASPAEAIRTEMSAAPAAPSRTTVAGLGFAL